MFYIVIILTCYVGDKWERKGSSWTVIIPCQANKGLIVLVSLCQHDINYSQFGRGNLNKKDVLIRLSCGQTCDAFSWSMIDRGGPSSLRVVPHWLSCSPECAKKGWAHHEEQTKEQRALHGSAPAPAPVRLPLRMDCSVKLSKLKPFSPSCCQSWCFITEIEILRQYLREIVKGKN